ncbi:MAG: hypothetical protein AAF196_01400 [Planctomycetota bacterium]
MHRLSSLLPLLLAVTSSTPLLGQEEPDPIRIHSVCDISQDFTFYMDGRFHTQYLKGVGRDARNWGSLERLDLSNVNLLVLTGGNRWIAYREEAIDHVESYVREGGTLLLMIDGADPMPSGASVATRFGARLTEIEASLPLRTTASLEISEDGLRFRGGRVFEHDEAFDPLLQDSERRTLLARRAFGKGHVLVGSRGLFGQRPDAKDRINADWVRPLLIECATTKPIDPKQPHRSTWVEHTRELGPLTLEFHTGTEPFAEKIAEEYVLVRPHLVAITGVEPAPGMLKRLLILPTGGGGFSSGERIAIGAFWGNYPDTRYPMVELIGHEAGHSWVLPYPEPLWNEPIATWLGIQVGKRLEMPRAQQTLERQMRLGRRHDPDFTNIDPLSEDAPRDLIWGKSYFVFEELERLHGPGALAKYFRAKRRLLTEGRDGYSMDDCVAVWSHAVEQDLFPWFRSLAFDVDASRSELWPR